MSVPRAGPLDAILPDDWQPARNLDERQNAHPSHLTILRLQTDRVVMAGV